jgi:hypothetical protein
MQAVFVQIRRHPSPDCEPQIFTDETQISGEDGRLKMADGDREGGAFVPIPSSSLHPLSSSLLYLCLICVHLWLKNPAFPATLGLCL